MITHTYMHTIVIDIIGFFSFFFFFSFFGGCLSGILDYSIFILIGIRVKENITYTLKSTSLMLN